MPDENQIRLHISTDYKPAGVNAAKQDIKDLGKETKKTTSEVGKSSTGIIKHLTSLGSQFRYLSLVSGIASVAMTAALKVTVDEALEMEKALLAVTVISKRLGYDVEKTTKIVYDFAQTGFFTVTEAANTLARMLGTGLNLSFLENAMWSMADVAALLRKGQQSMGESFVKTSQGILNQRDIMYESIGMYENQKVAIKRLAEADDKHSEALTLKEQQYYSIIAIMEKAEEMSGSFEAMMLTSTGTMTRMTANLKLLQAEIGQTLLPVLGSAASMLSDIVPLIQAWVKENSDLVSKLILGIAALVTFVTQAAFLGAMLPMIAGGIAALAKLFWAVLPGSLIMSMKGISSLTASLMAMNSAVVITNLLFAGMLALLAAVIIKSGLFQNIYNRITNLMKERMERLTKLLDDMGEAQKKNAEDSAEYDEDTLKRLAKIEQSREREHASYIENLNELVRKHAETIDELTADILKLDEEYEKSFDRRERDHNETMDDMEERHKEKVAELERDLECELSLGIRADQEKLRDLQDALAEEEKEYEKERSRRQRDYEEDVQDSKDAYEDKKTDMEVELEEEKKLKEKYKDLYDGWREFAFRDEIQKLQDRHQQIIDDLDDESQETIENAKKTSEGVTTALAGIEFPDMAGEMSEVINVFGSGGKEAGKSFMDEAKTIISQEWDLFISTLKFLPGEMLKTAFWGIIPTYLRPRQSGGWTARPEVSLVGEKGPELVSLPGGARVTPNNQLGSTVININNPIVRKEEDVREIGRVLEKVLARRVELRRLGAG